MVDILHCGLWYGKCEWGRGHSYIICINPYAINGPYMSLKATLSTDQWTIYGLLHIQTIALTSNFLFSTE